MRKKGYVIAYMSPRGITYTLSSDGQFYVGTNQPLSFETESPALKHAQGIIAAGEFSKLLVIGPRGASRAVRGYRKRLAVS